MDVSSVNSAPVSAALETPQRASQQQVQQRSEQPQVSEPQTSQQATANTDSRVGSRVDVFV